MSAPSSMACVSGGDVPGQLAIAQPRNTKMSVATLVAELWDVPTYARRAAILSCRAYTLGWDCAVSLPRLVCSIRSVGLITFYSAPGAAELRPEAVRLRAVEGGTGRPRDGRPHRVSRSKGSWPRSETRVFFCKSTPLGFCLTSWVFRPQRCVCAGCTILFDDVHRIQECRFSHADHPY